MSWKSLVTAGLLCVLATPVFAQPNMGVIKGGTQPLTSGNLDAAGNWVWTVTVTPDLTTAGPGGWPDGTGTPVAMEAGFTSSSTGLAAGQGNVISAMRNPVNGAGSFDTINPGAVVFPTWQTGALLDAGSNNRPTGIQTSCASGNCSSGGFPGNATGESYAADGSVLSTNPAQQQVFAALGSVNFTTAGPHNVMNITVQRPVIPNGSPNDTLTTTTIKVSGAYTGNARLTQITGKSGTTYTTSNFDTFGGNSYSFTRSAKGGDADLDGDIDFDDFGVLFGQYTQPAGALQWYHADFNGNFDVEFDDFGILFGNYGAVHNYVVGPVSPGAGAGLEASNIPEPASIALLGLAILGSLGVIRRKR